MISAKTICGWLCALVVTTCVGVALSDNQQPVTNNQQLTTNNRQLTTNNQQPTTNNLSLSIARQALRDGLWQVARTHAEKAGGDDGRLIVLESYASENRWDDVKKELDKIPHSATNAAYGYYVAVCDNRIPEAIALLQASGSEAGVAEAKMLEADLHVKSENHYAAKQLWSEVVAMSNVSERAFALASVNLGDAKSLRTAYQKTVSVPLKRIVGLRLGRALLNSPETQEEGAKLIRALVADNPDADGARDAFLALAAAEVADKKWKEAEKTICEAVEIWPDAVRRADVHEYRGEAFFRLGRYDEARAAFVRAEELSSDDASRARAVLKQGDALAELGRGEESMARYRTVLEKYSATDTAIALKRVVRLRELEEKGREDFTHYRFAEAMKAFAEVAREDADRSPRMAYYRVLCLYGLGRDGEALAEARRLSESGRNENVRAMALLWLAKFTFNRGEWRDAAVRFADFVKMRPGDAFAPEALLWSARAAYSANDLQGAIQTVTQLVERYPGASVIAAALLVQAEVLIEQARFDEAILVLDRAATGDKTSRAERLKAKMLKADALFAMGADNSERYQAALEAYRAVVDDEALAPGVRLSVAFKIGRVLEKLKRPDEATDQYYTQVVLAYRDGRQRGESYVGEGEAAFVRAAFRLADDFETRGRDYQAVGVLKLVAESNVPASAEAEKRIERILQKGRFL